MIRLAEEKDVSQIEKIFVDVFPNSSALRQELEVALSTDFVDTIFLVYEEQNQVLAFICLSHYEAMDDTYTIKWLLVDKHIRNKSIGTQLTSVALAVLRNYTIQYVMLMTPFPNFFRRFGFHVHEDRCEYKLMSRVLTAL